MLTGSTCYKTTSTPVAAQPFLSCNDGFSLDGQSCSKPIVKDATPVYKCEVVGQVLYGRICTEISTAGQGAVVLSGTCGMIERTYSCQDKPADAALADQCTKLNCDANGVCIAAQDQPDTDFGRTAAGMEMARQMGTYMDPNSLRLFNGEDSRCSKGNLGLNSCCASIKGAPSNASVGASLINGGASVTKEVADMGSKYLYDAVYDSKTLRAGLEEMIVGINTAAGGTENFFDHSFNPSFSYMGFTASVNSTAALSAYETSLGTVAMGTNSISLTFNPYALAATLAIQWITACGNSDMITGMRKGQNLCHHVGTYCKESFLGLCIKEEESHCCFNSRLARIVQQQGRLQLNKSWGPADAPICEGFTQAEISGLNFATMDLSEFINEIQAKAVNTIPGTNRASTNVTEKVTNYFSNGQETQGGLYLPPTSSGNLKTPGP